MSDVSQGAGWWEASDGKWYPPELQPDWSTVGPPGRHDTTRHDAHDDLSAWAPSMAPGAFPTGDPFGTGPYSVGMDATPDPTATGGRFGRGMRLVRLGFTMARDEPGLLWVPVVALVAQLVILGVAALIIVPSVRAFSEAGTGGAYHPGVAEWAVGVVAGVAVAWVSVVSHATIIARVSARFHGQQVTNTQAARAALTRSPALLAWAFINYVVMSILRNVSNRGILGLLVGSLLRAGWYLASFFVVPVILFEDRGAIASIKRSVALCKGRWGENIVGNGALGLIGFVAVLADVVAAVLLGSVFVPLGVVVGVLGLVAVLLVLTVATASFNAALYWFAVTGQAPGGYALGDLESAYRPRRERGGFLGS